MKRPSPIFTDCMTPTQRRLGIVYFPMHVFIRPVLISMLNAYVQTPLNDVTLNIIYYAIGFLFCITAMFRFLRKGFDILADNLMPSLVSMAMGYIFYYILSYGVSALMLYIMSSQPIVNPNDQTVTELIQTGSEKSVIAISVLIAPIVEEVLFRGVLFGGIRKRSRSAAYIISILLFAFYHIWQYLIAYRDPTILLYMLQYIPAGYVLAMCYEQVNSIWVPIFLHMLLNFINLGIV